MVNRTGSNLGFEERLWTAAEKLHITMVALISNKSFLS